MHKRECATNGADDLILKCGLRIVGVCVGDIEEQVQCAEKRRSQFGGERKMQVCFGLDVSQYVGGVGRQVEIGWKNCRRFCAVWMNGGFVDGISILGNDGVGERYALGQSVQSVLDKSGYSGRRFIYRLQNEWIRVMCLVSSAAAGVSRSEFCL